MTLISHTLVTHRNGELRVIVPPSWDGSEGFVVASSRSPTSPTLLRIQSRCAYGEVFGSRHCDCGPQLQESLSRVEARGGYVFYMEQEGRGAGIRAKASAYKASEDCGRNTFDHYEELGLEPDPRSYEAVARGLEDLKVSDIILLTNNPAKVSALREFGVAVEQESLLTEIDANARSYMRAKKDRGHLL